jgi:hypothetical protein
MAINLNLEIEAPDAGLIPYSIAHLIDKSYAGPDLAMSWEQGGSASLTFFCYWEDLEDFITAILGDCRVEDGRYTRWVPHQFPTPFFPNLWASKVTRIVGIPGPDPEWSYDATLDTTASRNAPAADHPRSHYPKMDDNGHLSYLYAAVTVQYESVIFPIKSDEQTPSTKEWLRFTSIQKVPRLEFLNIQGRVLYWIDDPEAKNIDAARRCPTTFLYVTSPSITSSRFTAAQRHS